jgi:hypothetical protein
VLWEVRNALWVFPLFLTGKIVLTYDQLELRPALGNELSSKVKGPLYTYTTLKFLALQGAPDIYDISRLRLMMSHRQSIRGGYTVRYLVWCNNTYETLFPARSWVLFVSEMVISGEVICAK